MAAKGPPLSVEGTLSCLDSGPRSLARRTHCGGSVTSIAKRQEAAPGRGAGRVLKTGPGFPPMQQAATTQAVRSAEDALLDPAPGPAVADFRQESGLLFSLKHVVCRRSLGAVGLGRCPPPPHPSPVLSCRPRTAVLGLLCGLFCSQQGLFPQLGEESLFWKRPVLQVLFMLPPGPFPVASDRVQESGAGATGGPAFLICLPGWRPFLSRGCEPAGQPAGCQSTRWEAASGGVGTSVCAVVSSLVFLLGLPSPLCFSVFFENL